jgi:hypothetical protein
MTTQLAPAKVTVRLTVYAKGRPEHYRCRLYRFMLVWKGAAIPISISKN